MKPLAIAITGGIASGKSFAAEIFAAKGDYVLDADNLVRQIYAKKEVQERLASRVAGVVQAPHQGIDFAALRQAAIADNSLLDWLEGLLHPQVRAIYVEALAGCQSECVVGVVPLLFEAAMEDLFDRVIALSIDQPTQRDRVLARAGMNENWLRLILSRQMQQQQRNSRADLVVSGTLLFEQLQQLLLDTRQKWLRDC